MKTATTMLFLLMGASVLSTGWAQKCPARGAAVTRLGDGSTMVTGGLNVNPDGTAASYVQGDHGFTYIANGLALWRSAQRLECKGDRALECRTKFLEAEARSFGAGTSEFCAFALEVEPIAPAKSTVKCVRGQVLGNGKGRPRVGGDLETVQGGTTKSYASTTALNQLLSDKVAPVDSAAIPAIVVPTSSPELVGNVAWVAYGGRSTIAVVGDTGPAFGEGTIALHQLLRYGELRSQKLGPIARQDRCGDAEMALQAPFEARPDVKDDVCTRKGARAGGADIRAYKGIDSGVTTVILNKAKVPMKGNVAQLALSQQALWETAKKAGYSEDDVKRIAGCT